MKQMRPFFRTAKASQMLENAYHRTFYIFHQVFADPGTTLSFILAEAYLLLLFNFGAMKKK